MLAEHHSDTLINKIKKQNTPYCGCLIMHSKKFLYAQMVLPEVSTFSTPQA